MELLDAIKLLTRLIKSGEKHADRERTVELADLYRKLITGKDIESLLIKFVQREDAALFEQRKRITKAITPAVASSIRKPFNKVVRNDRVRWNYDIGKSDKRTAAVAIMEKSFFGAARKQNRGLNYWLKTRFLELQFTDPNAWLVLEWSTPETAGQVPRPRPFEVSAEMAQNWLIINDEIVWLQIQQDITFKTISSADLNAEPLSKPGKRHTLYDQDFTVVFEQVDPVYLKQSGYVLQRNEQLLEDVKSGENYLVKAFTPNVGYVPAFRIGYVRDEVTKGRTFVNPWHDALCYFEKSLKTVSEMDLTMALHVFPQKLQYVTRCKGEMKQGQSRPVPCNDGRGPTGAVCGACKGAGVQIHTTAADVINIPMPDDPKEMFNLDQMLVYKAPPIETVKFQNEFILQLERQCHQTVYNSQVFVRKQYSAPEAGAGGEVTATETDNNIQSVYDTLEPFTEKYSELWMDIITTFGIIAGAKLEEITTVHVFPADFKLKTSDILLSERRTASTSGAPSFMIEVIDDDLADIIFAGDDLRLNKYYTKRRYYPFPGKSQDEIALLLSSELVTKKQKVLYLNFDEIFKELEKSNPEIWTPDIQPARVDELVNKKVDEFIQRIKDDAPTFDLTAFRGGNPAADEEEENEAA